MVKLGGAGTYNLSSYPGYQNFKVNVNIFLVCTSASFYWFNQGTPSYDIRDRKYFTPSASYTAPTLTVTNGYAKNNHRNNEIYVEGSASCEVYLVY